MLDVATVVDAGEVVDAGVVVFVTADTLVSCGRDGGGVCGVEVVEVGNSVARLARSSLIQPRFRLKK